jgi:hypothetical protein
MHSEYLYIIIIFAIVIAIVIVSVNSDFCGGKEEKYSGNNYSSMGSSNNGYKRNTYIDTPRYHSNIKTPSK